MKYYFFLFLIVCVGFACAQVPANKPTTVNPAFDKKISQTIRFSVPTISPDQLKQMDDAIIIDARELVEYEVSHIEGARFVSYNQFDINELKDVPKDATVILYCSIGYRSEKIGEKLQKAGYKNVHNLYGSIFEWVNQGNRLVDKAGYPTTKLHTYDRNWSKWVDSEKVQKVW